MAQAVPTPTLSTFIDQLLAPIADHIASREIQSELRRDSEEAWSIAYHRYHAAQARRSHVTHTCRALEVERRDLNIPEHQQVAQAHLDVISAINCLMMVPAPSPSALRMKIKLRGADEGRDRWDRAIAADEARLAERKRKR